MLFANIVEDWSSELGVAPTFCYLIIAIFGLTVAYALISWIMSTRREKKHVRKLSMIKCPGCGGDNKPDALLCKYCEEILN